MAVKKQTTTIMALLLTLGTSCSALALEEKGPPDAGIKVLKVTSNSDAVYANGMMQAEVVVRYDIDPNYSVKSVDLYELYTRKPLGILGYAVSTYQNEINGRKIPTVISMRGASEENLNISDKASSSSVFYVSRSENDIARISICAKLELDNGSVKDTCDGDTNDAFVLVNYVLPRAYPESDFIVRHTSTYYQKNVNPYFRMYDLMAADGTTQFFYVEADNGGNKLNYDNRHRLSSANAFVSSRLNGNKGSWNNSVFLMASDTKTFRSQRSYKNEKIIGAGEWSLTSAPKILNIVLTNLEWHWIYANLNGKPAFCVDDYRTGLDQKYACWYVLEGQDHKEFKIKNPNNNLEYTGPGYYGLVKFADLAAQNPIASDKNLVLRDLYGNKAVINIRIGTWANAYIGGIEIGA